MITLRPYQAEGEKKIRAAFMNKIKSVLYVLPTGGGKTVVFTDIAAKTSQKKRRALILVHRIELLRQTSKALAGFGIDHGLISKDYTGNIQAPIQVAMVKTMANRMEGLSFIPDLIITDEAHHAVSPTYRRIVNFYPDAIRLGVTATPCRTNGAGLDEDFEELIIGADIRMLIDMGYLVQPKVFAPIKHIDFSSIEVGSDGDYLQEQVEKIIDTPSITGDAVDNYLSRCDRQPAVAFCASRIHAENVAAEFKARGYRAFAVDGNTPDGERNRILRGLGDGSVDVVASCDLISEGTDIPAIACAILLRPTQSLGLYLQQVGRALRPFQDKKYAIILDHVGNVLRHGMPDEVRSWTLKGMKRKKKSQQFSEQVIKVRQCEKCYVMHVPAAACPECGHIYVLKNRASFENRTGELTEITAERAFILKENLKHQISKARTLEDLQVIEKARGYKPGWAQHILSAKEEARKKYRGKGAEK